MTTITYLFHWLCLSCVTINWGIYVAAEYKDLQTNATKFCAPIANCKHGIDYTLAPTIWRTYELYNTKPILTLKRPGHWGWLRPTQFKPRLDWVGSAAQVRRYCADSVAWAFIHVLGACILRSLQNALCGPRNSRSAHFAAHALDVLAIHRSPNLDSI